MDIKHLALPPVADGLFWAVSPYSGNYDDGIYPEGTRVTVGIRKRGFLGITYFISGVIVALADPRLGDEEILDAANYVYKSYLKSEHNNP